MPWVFSAIVFRLTWMSTTESSLMYVCSEAHFIVFLLFRAYHGTPLNACCFARNSVRFSLFLMFPSLAAKL